MIPTKLLLQLLASLCLALITSVSHASLITYTFSVTATSGPLTGVTSNGTFSYESRIVVPNTIVNGTGLLTSLSFTWDGVTYNAATANTGGLIFDAAGKLSGLVFGNNCSAGGCAVGQAQWSLGWPPGDSPNFVYRTLSDPNFGFGAVTITVSPAGPQPTSVPASTSAGIAILAAGIVLAAWLSAGASKRRLP